MATVVFIAFFGFNFVMPILPLYVRQLGAGDVGQAALLSGVMLGIAPLLAAFFSPLWGVVADRHGRKRMVQRSMLVMVVATVLMGLVTNNWQLFLLRASIGVFGGFTSMAMAYVVTVTPPNRASAALGLLQAAQMGGVIVGPLCAGYIADNLSLRAAFFGGAVVVFCGFLVLTFLTPDDRRIGLVPLSTEISEERMKSPLSGLSQLGAAARLPGFVAIMGVLFLVQVVDRSFGPVLPLYVESLGTPPDRVASFAGLVVSLAAAATAISATVVGRLAIQVPVQGLLIATLVAGMALCVPLAFVQSPIQLVAARSLLGLMAGGSLTLAYSLANAAVPADSKGAAFGVLSSVGLLGSALSPLAMGALSALDLRAVFYVNALLYGIALAWAAKARVHPLGPQLADGS